MTPTDEQFREFARELTELCERHGMHIFADGEETHVWEGPPTYPYRVERNDERCRAWSWIGRLTDAKFECDQEGKRE